MYEGAIEDSQGITVDTEEIKLGLFADDLIDRLFKER